MKVTTFLLSLCAAAGWLSLEWPAVNAQVPEAAQKAAKKGNGLAGTAQKELIYVTLPGSLERSPDQNGNGIVVLDARTSTTSSSESRCSTSPPARIPSRSRE